MTYQTRYTKKRAIDTLSEYAGMISELKEVSAESRGFIEWTKDVSVSISYIFGHGSPNHQKFNGVRFKPSTSINDGEQEKRDRLFLLSSLDEAHLLLGEMIREIEKHWIDNQEEISLPVSQSQTSPMISKSDFILNEHLVFMLSPFREPFDTIYSNHIKPTVENIDELKCVRADDIYDNRPVIDDIWRLTNEARIVVAELTGRNPNVFYETGLAHAINKEVILITQSSDDVPFDLRHRRYIRYQNTPEGIEQFKVDLTNTITNILGRTNESSVAERTTQLEPDGLTEKTPGIPPHGITGEICRKSGLYRVQNGGPYLIEKTLEKGDVFPSAATRFGEVGGFPLGMNEEKVTWVYQSPENDDHKN